jgi:peroxiredoxin
MKLWPSAKAVAAGLSDRIRRKGEFIMPSPGDPAPDFETVDHMGRPVRLADARGKTIVLWFYPKADTPG